MRHALAPLVLALTLASALRAQSALGSVNGNAGARLGTSVAQAGDVDGDGYEDVLVGAPGEGGSGRVWCYSGRWLGTGTGAQVLGLVVPQSLSADARFGASVAALGDINGDGVGDYAAGAPNHDIGASVDAGVVIVIDGATFTPLSMFVPATGARQHLGYALARVGDATGDGLDELAIGAPGENPAPAGEVYVLSGSVLASGGKVTELAVGRSFGAYGYGTSISSGFDFTGDGELDIVVGSPLSHYNHPESGYVWLTRALGIDGVGMLYPGSSAFEHLGTSVDGSRDFDGDGQLDLLIGAPDWIGPSGQAEGRALVVSGAAFLSTFQPAPLFSFLGGAGGVTPGSGWRLGAAVRATDDLNADGVADILIGVPDFFTQQPLGPGKGGVRVYSGATGVQIGGLVGANHDKLGDALLGAVDDHDGDGFLEFVVAGSSSDNPFVDCGVLKLYRLFPTVPVAYCTGKVNSQGCTPAIAWSGSPSASAAPGFDVTCSQVLNNKTGLLFYSHAPAAAPFQGGHLCAKAPLKRVGLQGSGGSPSGSDCTGAFTFDFEALILGGSDPTLTAGAELFCQWWSRDQQSASTTSLSNALRFVIQP